MSPTQPAVRYPSSTATNTVIGSPITPIGAFGAAVTPDGSKVYVTSRSRGTVTVIDTATNAVVGSPIIVGNYPFGVAVTPDGSKVYFASYRAPRTMTSFSSD
jgi:YVTN family beta-propeller protein